MLLIGMCTSLTKKPTKPMIRNPIIVADAMRANSFRSGFVHFFTRWIESCVCDVSVSRRRRGGGVCVANGVSRPLPPLLSRNRAVRGGTKARSGRTLAALARRGEGKGRCRAVRRGGRVPAKRF